MKRSSLCFVAIFILALVAAAAPKVERKGDGLFAPLQKGQKVALKEVGGRYEIGVVAGVDLGFKLVEIGSDFLVLEDLAGVTETRIPLFSIKAVTVIRLPKR